MKFKVATGLLCILDNFRFMVVGGPLRLRLRNYYWYKTLYYQSRWNQYRLYYYMLSVLYLFEFRGRKEPLTAPLYYSYKINLLIISSSRLSEGSSFCLWCLRNGFQKWCPAINVYCIYRYVVYYLNPYHVRTNCT